MYTDHYGLSGQPFQLTPDARFWFESRTHRKAMAYLGYGLAQGEGFIVITGEIGAGKSTLVAHLMATVDHARLNAISIVSTQVEGDDMLRLVAQGLGVPTATVDKARLLEAVEHRLEEDFRGGKRTLLVVDEAQNLPVSALEELRMLSNYQIGGRALLQIFLLGQPEFREKLASAGLEQLRQRVIATHHLEAMGADELEAYIRHRLRVVGWQGRPEFDAESFEVLHRATGGIPRRVNQLANRLMLHAAIEDADRIDGTTVANVAEDLQSDSLPAREDRVLPLRSPVRAAPEPQPQQQAEPKPQPEAEPQPQAQPQPEPQPQPEASTVVPQQPATELALERRLAALEARVEEQEASLRRVLTLLVDWIESDRQPGYRSNAA